VRGLVTITNLPEVPALPSFKLHKFVSDKIIQRGFEYRTGVVYTTNRRLWEWDDEFKNYLTQAFNYCNRYGNSNAIYSWIGK
jgi:hypothetical protein